MPYSAISDLPDSVKNILPKHAQKIYKEAFNSAYEEYKDEKNRQERTGREETAHKVAWSAVKQAYEKGNDGAWHKKAMSV